MNDTVIVVSVSGGNVNGIFTNNRSVKACLIDYDNLEARPNSDCSTKFPLERLSDFRSVARSEAKFFPGLSKLLVRLWQR
jgi:hypothetical protein